MFAFSASLLSKKSSLNKGEKSKTHISEKLKEASQAKKSALEGKDKVLW